MGELTDGPAATPSAAIAQTISISIAQNAPKRRPGHRSEKKFVANVSYGCLALSVSLSVVWATLDFLGAETTRETTSPLSYAVCGMVGGIAILSLLHQRFFGVSLAFKILCSFTFFCVCIFAAVTGRPLETWHMLMILVLDFVLIMRSEDDELIMDWLANALLIGFVVYTVLHNLSACGLGPDIHFVQYDTEIAFSTSMFCNISPVLLNFKLVKSYGRDLRSEAKGTRISVQAASDVGRALVDFDVDKALNLMACMEEDSPIFEPLTKLIHNLRTYRPFLPAYLFPQASDSECDSTNRIIAEAMSGKSTSWSHAKNAVERMRDPDYSLKDFHADVETAFPELKLYNVDPDGGEASRNSGTGSFTGLYSSGRTGAEEYQRTLGALYSVYCIARLDIDGREVFSFGVDANGKPVTATGGDLLPEKKVFYRSMDWKRMLELFARAGLLKVTGKRSKLAVPKSRNFRRSLDEASFRTVWRRSLDDVPHLRGSVSTLRSLNSEQSHGRSPTAGSARSPTLGSDRSPTLGSGALGSVMSFPVRSVNTSASREETPKSACSLPPASPSSDSSSVEGDHRDDWSLQIEVDVERMTAFLALTAIHDVMKNPCLSMTVHKKHAPYRGVAEGCHIHDHDLALMYIMEHFPRLLPSFHGLGPGQRAAVFFSQGKMGFNNGWLVQGEAPPGALFSRFKEVITLGGASESDIGFYFAHWLTDLAGAEPFGSRPWPGSEKFALKFPLKVLRAFLDSFNYVGRLNKFSEVEVMEEYLHGRWLALDPPEVAGAHDGCAVACKRVALMAQGFELAAVGALKALPAADRDVLAAELARTGLQEQFVGGPVEVRARPAGPALLVYYAPALVQKAGAAQAGGALVVLAAVCRAARELFPLRGSRAAVESTVVIRIEALKVLTPSQICSSGPWILRRVSPDDAVAALCGPDSSQSSADYASADVAVIRLPEQLVERTSSVTSAGVFKEDSMSSAGNSPARRRPNALQLP